MAESFQGRHLAVSMNQFNDGATAGLHVGLVGKPHGMAIPFNLNDTPVQMAANLESLAHWLRSTAQGIACPDGGA